MRWSASFCASDRSFVHSSTLDLLVRISLSLMKRCIAARRRGVEVSWWLVEEQELRPAQERPGHQQLLLHSRRIQAERRVGSLLQPHLGEHLADPLPPVPALQPV